MKKQDIIIIDKQIIIMVFENMHQVLSLLICLIKIVGEINRRENNKEGSLEPHTALF